MTERANPNVQTGEPTGPQDETFSRGVFIWSQLWSDLLEHDESGHSSEVHRLIKENFGGRAESALACVLYFSAVAESSAIEHGLPATSAWGSLEELGFTKLEIAYVVDTSEKTIQRKEKKAERLGVAEGDRTMRLLRIVAETVDAIGDREKALRWLRKPNRALGGKKPLEAIATERGVAMVRQSLAAIAYGGVA